MRLPIQKPVGPIGDLPSLLRLCKKVAGGLSTFCRFGLGVQGGDMHVQLHLHRNEMQILRSKAAAENCHACESRTSCVRERVAGPLRMQHY